MKRFLHVVRSANPADGGPIEVVARLAVEHGRNGRDVEVVTLDAPDAPWVKDFPAPIHALGPVSTKYGYTPRLVPWLREHSRSFDAVIVNGLWQYTGFATWRAISKGPTPYVVFTHGMLDPWFKRRYPLKHAKKWLYWPWAEYRVLRDASRVCFTSEEERKLARQSFWLYRCREEVVDCGTAAPPSPAAGAHAGLVERFPALAGKRLVLFLGRIHEKKGCDLLIRSFAKALRPIGGTSKPWHLVLAGPVATDVYRRHLERLIEHLGISGDVTWTGMLTGESKWTAFRAADVFALPSHQENFGVAVAEALACGTPVLISTKVNIWRTIVEDDAGLAEPDDEEGTDRLLGRWMSSDPSVRSRMSDNAVRCFANRFDVHETAERLASILDDLASR